MRGVIGLRLNDVPNRNFDGPGARAATGIKNLRVDPDSLQSIGLSGILTSSFPCIIQ